MPEINYQVTSMRWDAVGGCAEASITCYGPEQDLWEMIELLRCPVEIRNETGRAAWWGYINEVQVRIAYNHLLSASGSGHGPPSLPPGWPHRPGGPPRKK